jgi:RNA-directed DNA polymerase
VPAMAKQTETTPSQWAWVDRAIWTERMLAALGNGVKGGKWFSLIDKVYRPSTLYAAWQQVKANQGAAGIDQQSVQRFAAHEQEYLSELAQQLEQGAYQAQAVRRVDIPKPGGKTRPLGIPTVKDRIVQTAVKRVIEPIFENEFLASSYGFRPGKSCKDALRQVDAYLKAGYTHVVDADLKGYFDSIPHDLLKARIEAHISDGKLLELLSSWLRQDIARGSHQSVVGQPVPTPLGRDNAAAGLQNGALRRRLRHPVPGSATSAGRTGRGQSVGRRKRIEPAPRQDPCRGLSGGRTRIRVSGLPV